MHLPLKCLTRTNEVRSYINKCFIVLLLENSLIIMQTIGKNENKNKNKTAVKEQKVKKKKRDQQEIQKSLMSLRIFARETNSDNLKYKKLEKKRVPFTAILTTSHSSLSHEIKLLKLHS